MVFIDSELSEISFLQYLDVNMLNNYGNIISNTIQHYDQCY